MMGLQVSERFGGEATEIEPFNRSQAVDALTTQLAEGKPVLEPGSAYREAEADMLEGVRAEMR